MDKAEDRGTILKYLRMLVLVGGITACIQSIVWVFLTITGIIVYTQCDSKVNVSTYGGLMRTMYFTEADCPQSVNLDLYMKPEDLLIWQCVMLALMVLWFLSSILLIGGVRQSSINKQSTIYLILWSVLTLIISAIDLAMGIIFGLDSNYVLNNFDVGQLMSTVSGVLMTVALRGFILWIVNVAVSIYFLMAVAEIYNEENNSKETPHGTLSRGPLNAFENSMIEQRSSHWLADAENMDRPRLQNQLGARTLNLQGEVNQGYNSQLDQPNRYQQQQPLASIMKKSVAARNEDRSSQNRPKEYNIPSPDYSPPQMRKQYKPQMSDNSYNNNNYNGNFYNRR